MMCPNRIRLECVVQFNAPGVIGVAIGCIVFVGKLTSKVVVSVQFNVLLYGYACTGYPEVNVAFIVCIVELVGEIQGGVAEEHCAHISLYIVNAQLPGAWFISIYCTIGESCSPKVCMAIALVQFCLNEVTVKCEVAVAKAYGCTSAPYVSFWHTIANTFITIGFMGISKVESRNVSTVCNMAGQFAIPGFGGSSVFPNTIRCRIVIVIIINFIACALEAAITCFYANLAVVPSCIDTIEHTVFIPESAGLVEGYAETAEINSGLVIWCPLCIDAVHSGIAGIITFEVHFVNKTAIHSYLVIDVSLYVDTHTAIPGIGVVLSAVQVVLVLHTSIAGPVEVAHFLFQVAYANAQVSQFVSVFASQFIEGCTLFSVQLVFFSHEAGDDLSQFVTGHVPFTFEGAVRIAFYDALVGEVGYCLVSPVIRCNIRERICSVCGYASGECCYSSDCENLFHVLRSF